MKYKVSPEGYPILDQFSEEGFVDCFLKIVARSDHPDHYALELRASYKGRAVGMRVLVTTGIRGGFDANTNLISAHVYRAGVQFFRSGRESDELLVALAELYGMASSPGARMAEQVVFTGIALHEDGSVDLKVDPIKIKIFAHDGEDDPEELYSETFFNLDLKNGFVYWNEKDQDYRAPLVNGLSAPAN